MQKTVIKKVRTKIKKLGSDPYGESAKHYEITSREELDGEMDAEYKGFAQGWQAAIRQALKVIDKMMI